MGRRRHACSSTGCTSCTGSTAHAGGNLRPGRGVPGGAQVLQVAARASHARRKALVAAVRARILVGGIPPPCSCCSCSCLACRGVQPAPCAAAVGGRCSGVLRPCACATRRAYVNGSQGMMRAVQCKALQCALQCTLRAWLSPRARRPLPRCCCLRPPVRSISKLFSISAASSTLGSSSAYLERRPAGGRAGAGGRQLGRGRGPGASLHCLLQRAVQLTVPQ